jgi:transcriptional regulator with XRE-family HTH domain
VAAGSKVRNERLIALRAAQGWTQEELAAGVERELRRLKISGGAPGIRLVASWEDGTTTFPREHYRRALRNLLGVSTDAELGFARRRSPAPRVVSLPAGGLELVPDVIETTSYSAAESVQDGVWTRPTELDRDERTLVVMAAHESQEHAGLSGASSLDTATVENLHEEVERLARAFVYAVPVPLFGQMVRTRNLTYRLLDRTRKPQQAADLYLVAGQVCGLMSSASFDLGYLDAAAEQSRAAFSYGEIIGHDELRAWSRGMQAIVAMWSGRPQEAIDLVRSGQTYVAAGTAAVRLYAIEARAWSMLAHEEAVVTAVQAAKDARAEAVGTDELHDRVGGEFGFDVARQARCHGSAFLQLEDADRAVQETQTAVQLYAEQPTERRWVVLEAEAHADLAAAYLLRRTLDGAREALLPVFLLTPEQRIVGVTQRLDRVRGLLTHQLYRGSAEALALSEQIEAFGANSVVRALPAGIGL